MDFGIDAAFESHAAALLLKLSPVLLRNSVGGVKVCRHF